MRATIDIILIRAQFHANLNLTTVDNSMDEYADRRGGSARGVNFQVKLYEASGVAEFFYGSVMDGTVIGGVTGESPALE